MCHVRSLAFRISSALVSYLVLTRHVPELTLFLVMARLSEACGAATHDFALADELCIELRAVER